MTICISEKDRANNMLTVDTYVSNDNIKAEKIQKGMVVRGTLWFQGEIAVG